MSKLKIGLLIVGALIVGVFIGSSGKNSSTTGKVSSDRNEKSQQSTAQSGSNNSSISPQPSPESAGKVEVKSQTKRIGVTGNTEVVGEVINNTQNPVTWVKVRATFYDLKGIVVGTNFTYVGDTDQIPLAVGATSPFNISSYPDKINADSFKLDVTWR